MGAEVIEVHFSTSSFCHLGLCKLPTNARKANFQQAMKKNPIIISVLTALAATGIANAEPGKTGQVPEIRLGNSATPAELTTTYCLACHGDGIAGQARLAPPFIMVKMHYQSLEKEAFIKTVSSWIKTPDAQKSKMPGAVRRFGVMPALPLPDDQVAAIANYVYETDFEMPGHGGQGMGKGMGKGRGQGGGCYNSETTPASKSEAPACEACQPEKADPKVKKPACEACQAAPKAKAPACENCKPTKDETAAIARKWPVPTLMMAYLQSLEKDLTTFKPKVPTDHADLAKRIDENIKQLISSCTMSGESHDDLHTWLMPFLELATQHADSEIPKIQMKYLRKMRRAFQSFHAKFEPAPAPKSEKAPAE